MDPSETIGGEDAGVEEESLAPVDKVRIAPHDRKDDDFWVTIKQLKLNTLQLKKTTRPPLRKIA